MEIILDITSFFYIQKSTSSLILVNSFTENLSTRYNLLTCLLKTCQLVFTYFNSAKASLMRRIASTIFSSLVA